jgi:predicted transcriptional regulator
MKKLSKKQQIAHEAFLKYPVKSDNEIAKITGVSQPMISKYRKEYNIIIDKEFVAIVAGKFIHEFGHAVDHWKHLINELEELKGGTKQIVKQNSETGGYFQAEVPLEPMEKLQLIKEQATLRSRILFLASQGEVREVIKVMRTGQLPSLN